MFGTVGAVGTVIILGKRIDWIREKKEKRREDWMIVEVERQRVWLWDEEGLNERERERERDEWHPVGLRNKVVKQENGLIVSTAPTSGREKEKERSCWPRDTVSCYSTRPTVRIVRVRIDAQP